MLDVKLLGQFTVLYDGLPVELTSHNVQLLLAWLMLHAGTPQSREVLAEHFWPDASPENARSNLRHALWRLRSALGREAVACHEFIQADAATIGFNAASGFNLDVRVLELSPSDPTADALMSIVGVYGGELLPGFHESWVLLERERLAAVFEEKMETLLDLLAAEGRWADVIGWAEHWISLGSAPEPAYRSLMCAHAGRGHVSQAMATYRRCCEALRTELDTEPSADTQRLAAAIWGGSLTLSSADAHAPSAPAMSNALNEAQALADLERRRADLYLRQVRRLNRITLGLAGLLAVTAGFIIAARRR